MTNGSFNKWFISSCRDLEVARLLVTMIYGGLQRCLLAQWCHPLGKAAPGGQSAPPSARASQRMETLPAPSGEIYSAAQAVEKRAWSFWGSLSWCLVLAKPYWGANMELKAVLKFLLCGIWDFVEILLRFFVWDPLVEILREDHWEMFNHDLLLWSLGVKASLPHMPRAHSQWSSVVIRSQVTRSLKVN